MATHSSVLAWRIPGTEEPGGLPSMGSHRVGHNWSDLAAAAATRLLHPYSTVDKTSRLKMKIFSTVRDTQRGSQSYMEKRRGRREIEVTRMRWGGIKTGESKLASNHFLMWLWSTVWTAQKCSRSYTEKRRGRKETEVARRIKGGIKRRETDPATNQFPKCSPPSGTQKESHRVG